MPKPLPPELGYLQPIFKDMTRLFRRVDENYDTSELLAAMGTRLRGLSSSDALQALVKDKQALDDWLTDQPKHPGWFVSAFLESTGVVDLAREALIPAGARMSPFGVAMPRVALPPGYRLKTERSCLIVHKRSAALVVVPMPREELEEYKELMVGEGANVVSFSIGSVSGSSWEIMGTTTYAFSNPRSVFTVSVPNPGSVSASELLLVLESLSNG